MHSVAKLLLGAAVAAGIGATGFAAIAQSDPKTGVLATAPEGPVPDPSRVGVTLPKNVKCTGTAGKQETCYLYGDPTKPGPYTVLYRWYPGNFSRPHFHNGERWAYVVSGTWWNSASNVYDERTTYPARAGSTVIHRKDGIHWDGSRTGDKEPAVVILSGIGPNITYSVDENGKPVGPPR